MYDLNHTAFQSDPLSFASAIRTVCGLRNLSARLASDLCQRLKGARGMTYS